MNKIEYLLTCLQEEAGEITQASSKCLRFGLNSPSRASKTPRTNAEQVVAEINDAVAILELLSDEGFDIGHFLDPEQIMIKKERVHFYMQDSIRGGLLQT